jgi:hypothetical protein
MQHPLGSLLDGQTRRRKQIWPATIVEPVGDGTGDYECLLDETGDVVRASVNAPGATFLKRTSVILHRLDDGTMANGAVRWVIAYENRPLTVYGTGRPAPTFGDEDNSGSDVTLVNPDTVVATLGGGGVNFTINGVGLLGAVVSSNGGPTVILTELSRSDTQIVITYSALGAGTRGTYDLTVDARAFPKFFTAT